MKIRSQYKTWGALFVLCGLVMIFVALYIKETFTIHQSLAEAFLELLGSLGMALITAGAITILLDLQNWKSYFQQRLSETIQKRDYLMTLSQEELVSLQADTLKAFFKTDDIARSGSFLEYFDEKIKMHIGSPYREDTTMITSINYHEEDNDVLVVRDVVSYTCRAVGGRIQDKIIWMAERHDHLVLQSYSVEISLPEDTKDGDVPEGFANRKLYLKKGDEKLLERDDEEHVGFEFSLKNCVSIDKLHVKVCMRYLASKAKYFAWVMTHPSKNVQFSLHYPEELQLEVDQYGSTDFEFSEHREPGFYSMQYLSWVLPDSRLVFQLLEKDWFKSVEKFGDRI